MPKNNRPHFTPSRATHRTTTSKRSRTGTEVRTKRKPCLWQREISESLIAYTMRAWAGEVCITVCGQDAKDCKRRVRQICRDFALPIRKTLASARSIRSPYIARRAPRATPVC